MAPVRAADCVHGGGGSHSTWAFEELALSAGLRPRAWSLLHRLAVCLALLGCAAAAGAGPDFSAACMPAPSERTVAFRNTVVFNFGAGAGDDVHWNARTTVPTLSLLAPLWALAARPGWDLEAWFFDDGACTALAFRNTVVFNFGAGVVSSIGASVSAFNTEILPHERARNTRLKNRVQRLSVLTWAAGVWKGCLP